MNPVLVQVPCRRFHVRVKLGPAGGVGHVESLLLRRLGLGAATLGEVAELFGLPESLVLDRIVSLFRLGLVTLRPGGQDLHLGEAVLGAMGDPASPSADWQTKLGLPGGFTKDVELFREMISGAVFPRPRLDDTRWEHRLPPSLDLPPVDEIPKAVLLSAASSRLRDERTSMRNIRAFDVACVGGADAASTIATVETYGWIVVEVVGVGLDGDHPVFSVVGPSTVGRRVRDAIADGVGGLYQRGLVGPLADALRKGSNGAVEIGSGAVEGAETARETLTGIVEGVPLDVAPQLLLDAHERATLAARELDDALNAEAAHEGSVDVLIGAAAHRRLLLDSLRTGAQHQVIIAAPRVSGLARDDEMKDALVAAVSRGVRVHLLWGEARTGVADEFGSLHDLLDLLRPREQTVGGLFVSDRPSSLHASAFASDLRYVVAGSLECFGSPGSTAKALGVALPSVSSTDVTDPRARVPTALVETVQTLRQACPEATLRRVIVTDTVLDGGRPILRERSPMEFPSAPTPGMQIGVKIWKDEWRRWLRDLDSTEHPESPTVSLVPRGGHRRQLVRSFEQARRRIVVLSPRLGNGLLGAAMEPYILRALESLSITFCYRDVVPREDLTQRLRHYRARGLNTVQTDLEGNFIVSDDRAVVGSFAFGTSDGERGLVELGFEIRDPGTAKQLVELAATT